MSRFNNTTLRIITYVFMSGWFFWLVAFSVYACTIQSSFTTEGYWSIVAANLLDSTNAHTSPLYIILGRFFSFFAFGNTHSIAFFISLLSACAGAFSVFFIFRSVLYCAHTFINFPDSYSSKTQHTLRVSIASLAAVSFLFSNTVWHAATKPEIFSLLGFFFSVLIYLTFRWHTHKNSSYGMRYLYVIALILGLGVSIHVVMLTILPALIYFYTISTRICSFSKKIKTLVFSFVILCIIWIFSTHIFFYVAAYFDLFFVNYLTLPLNSGLLFFASLLILLFLIILTYTYTKKHVRVHHFFVIAALFCIGYSMFGVILIRANAHTPYNVGMQSHAFALTSHHSKYSNSGSLLYGTHYNAYPHGFSSESTFLFDSIQYAPFTTSTPAYHGAFHTLFPRMGSTQKNHINAYIEWAHIQEGKNTIPLYIHGVTYNKPTFFQNFRFFWNYQLGHMYGRYVLWNYAGQQNNIFSSGEPHKGNWITGLPIIDYMRLGAQDSLPQEYKNNISHNTYFAFPLLFAFLGFIFIFRNAHKYSSFLILLFLVSGPGIVVWLNSVPYTSDSISFMYILSFIPICICIGFGIIPVYQYITKFTQQKAIIFTLGISAFVPFILFWQNIDDHTSNTTHANPEVAIQYLQACMPHTILIVKDHDEAAPLEYAQSVLKIRQDVRIINYEMLSNSWYISKLRKQMYIAQAIKLTLPDSKYSHGVNNELFVVTHSPISHMYYPAQDILSIIASDNLEYKAKVSETDYIDYIPVPQTCIKVPEYSFFSKEMYPALDSSRIVSHICWNLVPKINDAYTHDTIISKQQLVVLDIIASNNWERPICFSKELTEKEICNIHPFLFYTGFYFQLYPMKTIKNYTGNGELLLETTFNNLIQNKELANANLSNQQTHIFCETCIDLAYAHMLQNDIQKLLHIQTVYKLRCSSQLNITNKKLEYAHMLFSHNDTAEAYNVYADISEYEQEKLLYFMHVPQKFHAKIIGDVLESLENMSELFDIYALLEQHTHCYRIASSTTIFIERFFEFSQQIVISEPNEFIEKNTWIYTLSEKNQLIAFWYNKMKVYLNSQ